MDKSWTLYFPVLAKLVQAMKETNGSLPNQLSVLRSIAGLCYGHKKTIVTGICADISTTFEARAALLTAISPMKKGSLRIS